VFAFGIAPPSVKAGEVRLNADAAGEAADADDDGLLDGGTGLAPSDVPADAADAGAL
jgi:hypothetical protein